MIVLIFIGILFAMCLSIIVRLTLLHPIKVVKNACRDTYFYIKHLKFNNCKVGSIVAYVGLFGRGKTLSAVHNVVSAYKRYHNKKVWCMRRQCFVTQKIKIISNVNLTIPYEQFISLEQVVRVSEKNKLEDDINNTLTVTLVLGDEFSVQLNSREFKKNMNPLFLNTLLTCRHHHINLYYTAQRFGHVDALLRQVTSVVADCRKTWRYQVQYLYNAWDLENATNTALIKPLKKKGWFVTDHDYNAYDTLACVGNMKKSFESGDMMSDEEILALQCNQGSDMEVVSKQSRKYKKRVK